uniref:Acylglycerol kinase, mitochondrial n=1 Tax=Cyprinus carpio TaxID=7962 RepID=A0A8C2CB72_CYPCA
MARVVKVFRTLRNHWKKSTFAVCVLSYGGHWLYGKHCDNVLRREACIEARAFGHELIGPQEHLKKAIVILNPAACNGKANRLFEKNAAPILHLAGVEVKIVKTDYEGQAKKLMELMDQTDMLIIAGGDGTLQEVITGLLRRADEETFSKIPIGFIPLGSSNSLSQSLHLVSDNKVQHITSATLSILKGETVPLDVLQIKSEKEQPVFALFGLRWGAFRDVASSISKYWYLGPLKTRAAHWFSSLKQWPQTHQASLSYLAPVPRPPDLPTEIPPRTDIIDREDDSMVITLDSDSLTVGQFITEGHYDLLLFFSCPQEGAGFYDIDNEEYEAMSVEVRLLPRKLRFFCSAERREQLAQAQ